MADRPFTWSPERGRYLYPSGRAVPEQALRLYLDRVIAAGTDRLTVWAQRLVLGTTDVLGFRVGVRETLRPLHLTAGALAHGGWGQLDPATRGFLGAQLRREYQYLDRLALDWVQGRLSPAQLTARLHLYAGGAHATHEAQRRRDAPTRGQQQERNRLAAATAHCGQCPAETARGWVPVGTLPLPGGRACLARCRCALEYRAAPIPAAVA